MVLDVVNKFRCRNSGRGIYKLIYKFYTAPPHKGKCHKVTTIPGVGCYGLGFLGYFSCVEKRLGGYWRKWKMFQGHFLRCENSS